MFRNAGSGPHSTTSSSTAPTTEYATAGRSRNDGARSFRIAVAGRVEPASQAGRHDYDPIHDGRDRDVVKQRRADPPYVVDGRLVRRNLDQAVDDRVATDSADQQ
jgi:hypothetical protein